MPGSVKHIAFLTIPGEFFKNVRFEGIFKIEYDDFNGVDSLLNSGFLVL